jgi:hypothetical protein
MEAMPIAKIYGSSVSMKTKYGNKETTLSKANILS